MQGLVNIGDEVEHTSLDPIFFPVCFLLNVALHYHREAQYFSYWWVQGVLLKDFYAHVAAVESISLYCVSECSWKTQKNNTTMILPYTQHNIFSKKLCIQSRLQRFVFVNSLLFALTIVINNLFFVTWNDILEK